MEKKLDTLYELCEVLMRELEEISEKIRKSDGMSAGDLEMVDKLSHALKSIKTTIAMMEAEDEGGYSRDYMPRRGMYYDERTGRSYARGRSAKRNSMGRYSREGGYSYADSMDALIEEMRGMMHSLPEEKRRKAERLMDELSR